MLPFHEKLRYQNFDDSNRARGSCQNRSVKHCTIDVVDSMARNSKSLNFLVCTFLCPASRSFGMSGAKRSSCHSPLYSRWESWALEPQTCYYSGYALNSFITEASSGHQYVIKAKIYASNLAQTDILCMPDGFFLLLNLHLKVQPWKKI